jgi:hypothetical protein
MGLYALCYFKFCASLLLYQAWQNKVKITIEPPIKALLEGCSLITIQAINVPSTVPKGKNIATSGAGMYCGAIVIKLNETARTIPLARI